MAEGNGIDKGARLFFSAMVLHRLGREREARTEYDRGVAWMKNLPSDSFTLRVRREAEDVLRQ